MRPPLPGAWVNRVNEMTLAVLKAGCFSNGPPIERLCIVQESGMQLFSGRYEPMLAKFIPFDDETFAKQYVADLNAHTDLPWYLVKVEVKIVGPLEEWTNAKLLEAGIKPLAKHDLSIHWKVPR